MCYRVIPLFMRFFSHPQILFSYISYLMKTRFAMFLARKSIVSTEELEIYAPRAPHELMTSAEMSLLHPAETDTAVSKQTQNDIFEQTENNVLMQGEEDSGYYIRAAIFL